MARFHPCLQALVAVLAALYAAALPHASGQWEGEAAGRLGPSGGAGAGNREARLRKLREDEDLPLVWLDIAINGTKIGRVEAVLYARKSPRAAENFRLLCSGELGQDAEGKVLHFKGSWFYRIIHDFIDQTGADADGIFGGHFHCDPGGLALKHTHKGLLSMAHIGPNTNGGHFSIMMNSAHHLDGQHVVFGEVVEGLQVIQAVNDLAKGRPNNELCCNTRMAQIVDAGQTRPGTYVSTPQYQAVIAAERRRVAWRNKQPPAEIERLRKLFLDESLPLVYLDIAINGTYIGRMEFVLFAKDSPLASENFRLLCTGEAGSDPAGKPYHFKGITFYRIIQDFIDQAGAWVESPLGGQFLDDAGGLRLLHDRMGLLSIANMGPNTNGAHFSIMMSPQPHLNGKHTVFGEMVDGHDVAFAVNALAHGRPKKELVHSKDVVVVDSGEIRRGSHCSSPEFQSAIQNERQRIQAAAATAAAAAGKEKGKQ
ncbi:hypothetical protein CHLRE_10g460650v5 [Chlamydomonas reinhardtii]|uniref:PPIase cyclophilin-type domain-containing protein n=1 Tax=Chlamydomonas reinhardtii TaxID=3055 RepID=A0A2K3DBU5_CHLRE|nr:uncharacterized protein CHLRE_10g460650v5 [Chlamydomonas reinhardtii]PNW78008.1 hypothetical protein CHLRE_10g460650v5 [Chlamydomonas reinhardtii]